MNTRETLLRKDARGRVRFSRHGHRFEVSKTGTLSIYARCGNLETRLQSIGFLGLGLPMWAVRPTTLRQLADAIDLAVGE